MSNLTEEQVEAIRLAHNARILQEELDGDVAMPYYEDYEPED